jgi:tRNA A37 threonylcarbamoyladenosine modification protein TsaB
MILYINTIKDRAEKIQLCLIDGKKIIANVEFGAQMQQAEKLLPSLQKILNEKKLTLNNIKKIRIENEGGSFSALRIGVATANALGYALKIPVQGTKKKSSITNKKLSFSLAKPYYNGAANITIGKKRLD